MKYYIMVKRKGAKKPLGAIPAKKGVTKSKLQKVARNKIKSGYSYRIVSESMLRRYLSRLVIKNKRNIKRKKVTKRKRR